MVDVDGTPSDCRTVETSHTPSLDQKMCTVAMRLRYTPAKDKAGKPMRALDFLVVKWLSG